MKRKILREQNWSTDEKIGLLNHLRNHIKVIESREPFLDMNDLRNRAWQNIHYEMKRKCISSRDIIRLKEGWSRMKNNAKIEMSTFATMINKHGVQAAFKWRPSNVSIEVKRLLQSVQTTQSCNPKTKKEIDMTARLLRILDSYISSEASDRKPCQIEQSPTALTCIKDEESGTDDDDNLLLNVRTHNNENTRFLEDSTTETNAAHKRRAYFEGEDFQEDNSEDIASFPEIEYTKEDNRVSWSYDALNEEHKMRLQILNTELERAGIQKRTALNELRMSSIKLQLAEAQANAYHCKVRMSGERGSGAGQGGGGGGAIRSAGGSFGKMEAAHEDQYFYNQQKEQLKKMREELTDEISFHEEQIKRHEEAINRHKKRINDMEK